MADIHMLICSNGQCVHPRDNRTYIETQSINVDEDPVDNLFSLEDQISTAVILRYECTRRKGGVSFFFFLVKRRCKSYSYN